MTNRIKKAGPAIAAAGAILGLAVLPLQAQTAGAKKPNVVFILADNVGYGDLGPYGGGELRGAPTPRIDQLAKEGMRLTSSWLNGRARPPARR
jgi:hypothetical protein